MALLLPAPYAPRALSSLAAGDAYDGFLCSLGFERRARSIAEHLPRATHSAAIGFPSQQTLSYAENAAFFAAAGFERQTLDAHEFHPWVAEWLRSVLATCVGHPCRVGVDVSSMTRLRIAAVVEAVAQTDGSADLEVDFLYAPEAYHEPSPPADATLTIGPVSSYFAGWSLDLELPLIAIVGVGYELEKAAGAIEYVEPQETVVFVPEGRDSRFSLKVAEANVGLWAEGATSPVTYPLNDPFVTLARLDAATAGVLRRGRPLLLPMGPKIFALVCMVVAALHEPDVAVWRVSAGELERPVDRHADGTVFGLSVGVRRDAVVLPIT
jgi:hypothetical protein